MTKQELLNAAQQMRRLEEDEKRGDFRIRAYYRIEAEKYEARAAKAAR